MKATLLMVLTLLVLGNSQQVGTHAKNAYLIVKGVIEGVQVDGHVEVKQIMSCLKNSEQLIYTIGKAIENLKTNAIEEVKEGIKLIGVAIQQIPDSITTCESGSEEMVVLSQLLTNMLEQLRNPQTFSYEMSYKQGNQQLLYIIQTLLLTTGNKELMKILENRLDLCWFNYLKQQKALRLLFLMANSQKQLIKFKIKNIKDCLDGVRGIGGIMINFNNAVRNLEDGSLSSDILSLSSFVEVMKFSKTLKACKSAWEVAVMAGTAIGLAGTSKDTQSFIQDFATQLKNFFVDVISALTICYIALKRNLIKFCSYIRRNI
ncbi:unnamed protein product [Paramecium octaurelia]|uniref:Uncharacterized protein n=1 Tax=Paramecium octaurelia TaxID=43137 RepID=A0A8S1WSL6_PAROT|nr:unnamed protein product [Paramecium octaurelia]